VQGAAAAAAVPSALRLLTAIAPNEQVHRRAVAAWSAAGAAAGASGFVVGGLVTEFASWRAIFWAYVPLAAVLGVAVLRSVPSDGRSDPKRPLEAPGSLLLTATVMAIVLGATVLPDRPVPGIGLLLVAVLAGGLFVRADRRSRRPVLPLLPGRLLRLGAGGSFVNTATTSSTATLVTLYWQDTLGRSALTTAAALLPFSLSAIAGAALAPRLMRRWPRPTVAAIGLATIGVCLTAMNIQADSVGWVTACLIPTGVGLSLSSVASTSLGTSVAEEVRASAAGLINTAAQVGTAVGIAALVLLAAATSGVPAAGTGAPLAAWFGAGAVALLASAWFARSARFRDCESDVRHPGPVGADRR
jgi:MFS family permease